MLPSWITIMFQQVGVLLQGEGGVDLSCSPARLLSADPVVKVGLGFHDRGVCNPRLKSLLLTEALSLRFLVAAFRNGVLTGRFPGIFNTIGHEQASANADAKRPFSGARTPHHMPLSKPALPHSFEAFLTRRKCRYQVLRYYRPELPG